MGIAGPLRALLELAHERVAVELRQARVAEDEVGRERLDLGERVEAVGRRRDAVAGLLQADFEHADAARVGVHEEQLLLGHGASVSIVGG